MTDPFDAELEQFSERVPAERLAGWRFAPDAWRWSRRLDRRYVNSIFRLRSARVIPRSFRARFLALGIPADIVDQTLRSIRSVDQWGDAWIETAQRFLGDYRRQVSGESPLAAEEARRLAAMCYHIAQILIFDDDKTITLCRASTASLFAQAQPRLYPYAHRLRLPWRTQELPAYYMVPEDTGTPTGLVVLLNGATTAKEETFAWSRAFIQRGLAVVVIDSPGTGEATRIAPYRADDVDVLDGVFELVAEQPNLDPRRVAVAGVSMGGNQAIRSLAYDRRIMAAVAVTPVYDPARWISHTNPLLRAQLQSLSGDYEISADDQAAGFALGGLASRIRRPVLVYGGGRDLIVPPADPQMLAASLGRSGTLVWFPDGGHCLYDVIPQWTSEAATWLDAIGRARVGLGRPAVEDPVQLAIIGREALQAEDPVYDPHAYDEDLDDYARLVTPQPSPEPGRAGEPRTSPDAER